MKIVRRLKPKIKTIHHKCNKCGGAFEYDENDVQSDRDGRYVVCPVCGAFISSKL